MESILVLSRTWIKKWYSLATMNGFCGPSRQRVPCMVPTLKGLKNSAFPLGLFFIGTPTGRCWLNFYQVNAVVSAQLGNRVHSWIFVPHLESPSHEGFKLQIFVRNLISGVGKNVSGTGNRELLEK